jgi:hypothetical protein
MNNTTSMMLRMVTMNNSDTVVSQFKQGDTFASQEKEEIYLNLLKYLVHL